MVWNLKIRCVLFFVKLTFKEWLFSYHCVFFLILSKCYSYTFTILRSNRLSYHIWYQFIHEAQMLPNFVQKGIFYSKNFYPSFPFKVLGFGRIRKFVHHYQIIHNLFLFCHYLYFYYIFCIEKFLKKGGGEDEKYIYPRKVSNVC